MATLEHVYFAYLLDGTHYSITTADSAAAEGVSLTVTQTDGMISAKICAEQEIVVQAFSAEFRHEFNESDSVFLNGYQSWTDSIEHGLHDKMRGLKLVPATLKEKYAFAQYGDYNFTSYPDQYGIMHGWSYGYVRNAAAYALFASLNEDTGFTCFTVNTHQHKLFAKKDCAGLHLSGEYGMELLFAEGSEKQVFDAYFAALRIPPCKAKPLFGYTSWYRHYEDISEQKMLFDLGSVKTQKFPADVFQIDDGWQTAVGDWLRYDTGKFPSGMARIAEKIREADMTAGLWLAPFVCEEDSDLFRAHSTWLLYDEKGEPVRAGSNWTGAYVLDIYNLQVRAYLRDVLKTVTQEWGYKLLKLDFLYAVCIQPRPDKTRGQIMAEAMDFLRECVGDAQILACGVPLASVFGKAEYCRIGCDVSLDFDDKPYMRIAHRERISTKNAILNAVFRRQLDGRAFRSDPDVFLLRNEENSMTSAQRQMLAEVCGMTGGVLFTSDDMALYDADQLRLVQRMRNLQRYAEITGAELRSEGLVITLKRGEKQYTRKYKI